IRKILLRQILGLFLGRKTFFFLIQFEILRIYPVRNFFKNRSRNIASISIKTIGTINDDNRAVLWTVSRKITRKRSIVFLCISAVHQLLCGTCLAGNLIVVVSNVFGGTVFHRSFQQRL